MAKIAAFTLAVSLSEVLSRAPALHDLPGRGGSTGTGAIVAIDLRPIAKIVLEEAAHSRHLAAPIGWSCNP